MEVGGRYQIVHLCLRDVDPDSAAVPFDASVLPPHPADFDEVEPLLGTALSFLSVGADTAALPVAALPKSNAVPGVFGVLLADPKDAKAPDPKPKALEAPPVGDDIAAVEIAARLLKGLRLLWELSPPAERLVAEKTRED